MRISVKILATIISACLAAGSSGAWYLSKATEPIPVVQSQTLDQKNSEKIAVLEARQGERDKALDQRLSGIEAQLAALNEKFDRALIKRDR
jgi:hypothetical protein